MQGRVAFGFTLAGTACAAALVPAALLVPMYAPSGDTLVDVNGPGVLVPVSVPLLISLVVWAGLWRKCTTGSVRGEHVAAGALGLLGFFTFLAMFSIGVLILPAVLLLVVAVVTTPRPGAG
jgi:hypothetical protein